jgi:hypothetical protein
MTDLLMVNIYFTSLGTYNGGGYALLQKIVLSNIRLFGERIARKKILIVVRDFNEETDNLEENKN